LNQNSQAALLIVDDEEQFADFVSNVAEDIGLRPVVSTKAEDFKQRYAEERVCGIVMDVVMPDTDGIELVQWLGDKHCPAPIVVVSGYDPSYTRMLRTIGESKGLLFHKVLTKPVDLDELDATLGELKAAIE
jgi:DNA-binding NtrC family response regulator